MYTYVNVPATEKNYSHTKLQVHYCYGFEFCFFIMYACTCRYMYMYGLTMYCRHQSLLISMQNCKFLSDTSLTSSCIGMACIICIVRTVFQEKN